MSTPLARKMQWTEEEYLAMEADSPIKHEFCAGEVYAMAGAKLRHNTIAANVQAALHQLLRGRSCRVFNSDQRIHIASARLRYTYPDGGVVCGKAEYAPKDPKMSLMNPILLFEVLSPSTGEYDRGTKLAYYRQIPSLVDVLLIDQPRHLVEHHHRGGRGWKETQRKRGAISLLDGVLQIEDIYHLADIDGEEAE